MGNILGQIFRKLQEDCNGRITITAGCWVFEPPRHYKLNGNERQSTDATGQTMTLIGKQGVFCPNPEIGDGNFPQSTRSGIWFVPWSFCRKCEYYRKTGEDGLRYPHCNWIRLCRGGDRGAAEETLGIVKAAAKFADEMVK